MPLNFSLGADTLRALAASRHLLRAEQRQR